MTEPIRRNGATRILRLSISTGCGLVFFGLIISEYTGHLIKDVPTEIYTFLITISLLGTEASFEKASKLVDVIWGRK